MLYEVITTDYQCRAGGQVSTAGPRLFFGDLMGHHHLQEPGSASGDARLGAFSGVLLGQAPLRHHQPRFRRFSQLAAGGAVSRRLPGAAAEPPGVITSYSIHYTKLYE